jgi:hypothetical protein
MTESRCHCKERERRSNLMDGQRIKIASLRSQWLVTQNLQARSQG